MINSRALTEETDRRERNFFNLFLIGIYISIFVYAVCKLSCFLFKFVVWKFLQSSYKIGMYYGSLMRAWPRQDLGPGSRQGSAAHAVAAQLRGGGPGGAR